MPRGVHTNLSTSWKGTLSGQPPPNLDPELWVDFLDVEASPRGFNRAADQSHGYGSGGSSQTREESSKRAGVHTRFSTSSFTEQHRLNDQSPVHTQGTYIPPENSYGWKPANRIPSQAYVRGSQSITSYRSNVSRSPAPLPSGRTNHSVNSFHSAESGGNSRYLQGRSPSLVLRGNTTSSHCTSDLERPSSLGARPAHGTYTSSPYNSEQQADRIWDGWNEHFMPPDPNSVPVPWNNEPPRIRPPHMVASKQRSTLSGHASFPQSASSESIQKWASSSSTKESYSVQDTADFFSNQSSQYTSYSDEDQSAPWTGLDVAHSLNSTGATLSSTVRASVFLDQPTRSNSRTWSVVTAPTPLENLFGAGDLDSTIHYNSSAARTPNAPQTTLMTASAQASGYGNRSGHLNPHSEDAISAHVNVHPIAKRTTGPIACATCDKVFHGKSASSNHKRHAKEQHQDELKLECPFCRNTYRRNDYLRQHARRCSAST